MTTIDMVIVALYAIGLFGLAQWVSCLLYTSDAADE